MVNAIAEVDLSMRRYPFDKQSLQAVFEIAGFHDNEVKFVTTPAPGEQDWSDIKLAQWRIMDVGYSSGQTATTTPEIGRLHPRSRFRSTSNAGRSSSSGWS